MNQLNFARQLRTGQTNAENLLWSHLRGHRLLGLKFRRQQPVGEYIVDFFCAENRLIVELDGGQHQDRVAYDAKRDAWLKSEGYTVLRYWNNEVMGNLEGVLEDICRQAGVLEPPSPLPLPPRGGGATTAEPSGFSPLSLEGRGAGGEGGASS